MDKVKVVLFKLPFAFKVLHYKLNIWGHPTRLNGADVIPNNVGVREFSTIWSQSCWLEKIELGDFHVLGNVQSPNACSGSQVENVVW